MHYILNLISSILYLISCIFRHRASQHEGSVHKVEVNPQALSLVPPALVWSPLKSLYRGPPPGPGSSVHPCVTFCQPFFWGRFWNAFFPIYVATWAQVGPTWLQLGPKNLSERSPKPPPQSHFWWKAENLDFDDSMALFLYFWCPRGALGDQVSLKNWCSEATSFPRVFGNIFFTTKTQKNQKSAENWFPKGGPRVALECGFRRFWGSWAPLGATMAPRPRPRALQTPPVPHF